MLKKFMLFEIIVLLGWGAGFPDGEARAESASRYTDRIPGLKEQDDLPIGPRPLLETGQGYTLEGPYELEFELPTGMVVSPGLIFFGNLDTGLQVTDNGVADSTSEWITTLDLFLNLTLSGTERILIGVSPLERPGGPKTRYQFQPNSGFINETGNFRLTSAFFEGELTEIFPKLDWEGRLPLDYEISFGRQAVVIQDGIMINDTLDSVALTRSTLLIPGANFARIGGFVALNNVHRSNNFDDGESELYGIFSSADLLHSTVNLDLIYIDSTDALGDQINVGASLIRAFTILGRSVDTTIHFATSLTPDDETAQATDGALLYSSFSWAPEKTSDIIYVNSFAAFDSYAPAARGSGGPLGITGLLFAGNGLAGAPISNRADHAYGGSLGYQKFFSLRRNLILEVGGKVDNSRGGIKRGGAAVRYSQAIGQHVFFEIGGFVVEQESADVAFGVRTKISVAF